MTRSTKAQTETARARRAIDAAALYLWRVLLLYFLRAHLAQCQQESAAVSAIGESRDG